MVFLEVSQAFFLGYRAVSGVMLPLAESPRSMQLYLQKKQHQIPIKIFELAYAARFSRATTAHSL